MSAKKIVPYPTKKTASEFVTLDDALQAAFDKYGEWSVREWLYARLLRIRALSRNRAPKKIRDGVSS